MRPRNQGNTYKLVNANSPKAIGIKLVYQEFDEQLKDHVWSGWLHRLSSKLVNLLLGYFFFHPKHPLYMDAVNGLITRVGISFVIYFFEVR